MATNVTVEFALAQEEYRKAGSAMEKLRALEKMYATVPKHKGTEVLRADIGKKMAYWRKQVKKETKKAKRKSFSIRKEAPTVGIIGLPNVGKSLLVKKLTNANTNVAPYEFSTNIPTVGILKLNDTKIQLIDFIPLIKNIAFNSHLRQYFSPLRICDLLIILIKDTKEIKVIKKELDNFKIKLGKQKSVRTMKSDHLEIQGWQQITDSTYEDIQTVAKENGFNNHLIMIDEPMTINDFVIALDNSYFFVKYSIIKNLIRKTSSFINNPLKENKTSTNKNEFERVDLEYNIAQEKNFKELKSLIWTRLELIRIYTRDKTGKIAKEPIILNKNSKIKDLATSIHKEFIRKFKFARVWGKSAKFPGQKVGLEHILKDSDVVEVLLK